MALIKKKKKRDDEFDASIIDDYKEPFTWANFWDEKVVGSFQKAKKLLDDRGIIFFLTSPFQYRNRLIIKLVVIVLGTLLGVVPRANQLIEQTKERNAQSEFSQIVNKRYSAGQISVSALMSSQFEKTHLLAFNIEGETAQGVPSTTEGFEISMSVNRGVMDEDKIRYSYQVVPVNERSRLLLVYVDNTKQGDDTGIYNLKVKVKDGKPMRSAMEIILSNSQETTELYNETGIHLSALSRKLSLAGEDKTPIKDAENELKMALDVYETNYDRLVSLENTDGSKWEVGVSRAALEEYISEYSILSNINDESTSDDVVDMKDVESIVPPVIVSSIVAEGQTFNDDRTSQSANLLEASGPTESSSLKPAAQTELQSLTKYVQDIQNALIKLNSARMTKFTELKTLARTLNSDIDIEEMKDAGKVSPRTDESEDDGGVPIEDVPDE